MLQGNIHLNIKPVQRNKGQCLVARVAYATGSSIYDPRSRQWHNYRWKKSEVGTTVLITRQGETTVHAKYAEFWGAVEKHHKRKDAVPGRTMSVALPCELSIAEQKKLMLQYGRWFCETFGVGVQISAHKLGSHNPHFHVALTACEVFADGTFGKKVTALDPICAQRNKDALAPAEILRVQWAGMVNAAYAKAGVVKTVDHRSYLRRSIDKAPQRHEGIWQHLPCPVDCPGEYNTKIKFISEVLHGNGTSISGIASKSHGLGENASDGMERDQGRTAQSFHAHQCIEHGGAQSFEGSPDADGDDGRSAEWIGSAYPDGNAESQNDSGHIDENQQGNGEYANAVGRVAGAGFSEPEGLMQIVTLPLVQAVESLYVQTLKTQQTFLRMTAASLPEVKVQPVSLCGMVGNSLGRATQSLELNTLYMQNSILQLRMEITPLVTIEKQNLLDTVTQPLATAIYYLEKSVNYFEKQIASLHENIVREAAKEVLTAQQPLASPTPLQTKKEPTWDEKLWQHIVHIGKQQPEGTEKAKAVFAGCATILLQYPQLTLADFAYILQKHSVRTEEEQNKIIRALMAYMEQHAIAMKDTTSERQVVATPQSYSAQPVPTERALAQRAPAAKAPEQPMLADLQSAQDVSETGAPPSVVQHPAPTSVVVPVKASKPRVEACPPVTVITLGPKRPEVPKVNTVSHERAPAQPAPASPAQNMPSRPPSLSTAEKQHRRKLFEGIIRQQNLPHTTIEEKKHQVLMAAIAFWREYPHLHFDHVEPLLHRYLDFSASDRKSLRQRLWQNRPEHPEEAVHGSAQEASSSTAELHVEDSVEAGLER